MPTPIVRLTKPEGVPEWLWETELALFDPLGLVTPLAITRKAFTRALERVGGFREYPPEVEERVYELLKKLPKRVFRRIFRITLTPEEFGEAAVEQVRREVQKRLRKISSKEATKQLMEQARDVLGYLVEEIEGIKRHAGVKGVTATPGGAPHSWHRRPIMLVIAGRGKGRTGLHELGHVLVGEMQPSTTWVLRNVYAKTFGSPEGRRILSQLRAMWGVETFPWDELFAEGFARYMVGDPWFKLLPEAYQAAIQATFEPEYAARLYRGWPGR